MHGNFGKLNHIDHCRYNVSAKLEYRLLSIIYVPTYLLFANLEFNISLISERNILYVAHNNNNLSLQSSWIYYK